jgi:hypothetical protein
MAKLILEAAMMLAFAEETVARMPPIMIRP